jgi:hypothetical protein
MKRWTSRYHRRPESTVQLQNRGAVATGFQLVPPHKQRWTTKFGHFCGNAPET